MQKTTPSEKAKEIVDRMQRVCGSFGNGAAAAIILCDEIIAVLKLKDGPPGSTYSNPGRYYWEQVKKNILSL